MTTTFDNLVTFVADELERTDDATLARIPAAINDAQERICRDAQDSEIIGFNQYVAGFFTLQNPVIPKPARWRRTIAINYGTVAGTYINILRPMSRDWCLRYSPDTTVFGPPEFYSDFGFYNIYLSPTPDINYPFQMAYLELPPPLSAAVQTNWLTNYAPYVLKYATFIEMAPYLRNFQDLPTWESLYAQRIASLRGKI